MSRPLLNRFLLIGGIILACLACMFPLEKRINLGLDLRGGMHLILRVEADKLPAKQQEDAVARAMEILRNRIDSMGVGETVVQRQGQFEILVQLPGVTDRDRAVEIIKRVAHLEFRLVNKDAAQLQEAIKGQVPEGYELKYTKDTDKEPVLVASTAAMQGDAISDAKVDFDQTGISPRIVLTFNGKGTSDFGQLTQNHVGEKLAIILDGEVMSAPNIREPILTGNAEITGQYTYDEASILALALRSGSLPVPISIEEERTIGPLLGKDSIDAGLKATIIGTLLVVIFMTIYYFIGGIIANFALLLNLLITVGIMGLLNILLPHSQVTLTLPGIAGLALTLGMAVDANVLINERIREELENGRPLAAAVNAGYDRALSAIIDSNMTTIIAAGMLFMFGSGPIKGFAITLTIGLMASLFTAVYVTRTIFMFFLEQGHIKTLKMLKLIGVPKFNFIKWAPIFIGLSLTVNILAMITFVQKGEKAYGIDFSGGQIQEYRFSQPVHVDVIRSILDEAKVKDAVIQQFDKTPDTVIIRTPGDNYETVQAAFKDKLKGNSFETLRIEKVGPTVGKKLRSDAVWAMLLALVGILIYVGIRFKHYDFAAASVIALLHDVLIALGITVMAGRQVDLLVITALLTIAGYSINDTIVIYDRVRENFTKLGNKKVPLVDIINLSINQTLGRTILTTLATMLVVVSLYLWGGEVLNTFSFTILVGFFVGMYSTIFVVSPIVIWWNRVQKTTW